MNKKMFIICVVLVLLSSCKNDESKKEKSLDNLLDDIGLEVEKLVQADGAQEQAGNKAGGAAGAAAGAGGAAARAGAVVPGVAGAGGGAGGGAVDNIKKQIAELKKKIDNANSNNTSLKKYSEYEQEVAKIKEALKKGNGNNGNELNQIEGSLKTKKDARKKELEESKKKFEELKTQVAASTGRTHGDQAKNRGQIGAQAFGYAQKLGLRVNADQNSRDTNALVNQVINGAIKKIEEELEDNNLKKE